MRRRSVLILAVVACWVAASAARAAVIDFEDISLASEAYDNGVGGAGGFSSGGATFTNAYDSTYNSWRGWAASNRTDAATPGYGNQYSALPGSGGNGSQGYGVAFLGSYSAALGALSEYHNGLVYLPSGLEPTSVQVANTAYAAHSMSSGDAFAKRFGGASGSDPDWFRLTINGITAEGDNVATADVYLADFRSPSATGDYIASDWINVDLGSFHGRGVTSLTFEMNSSDTGTFGMNTPGYIALDNLVLAPTSPIRIAGDTNFDGRVDGVDLAATVSNLGMSSGATWQTGDFNDDGRVSLADLMLLRSRLSSAGLGSGDPSDPTNPTNPGTSNPGTSTPGSGNPASVPEPQSVVMLVAGAGLMWLVRRRRVA
ncbi:MAG: DUF4465 domain-containing protein [Pirellulales bacterium]